MRVSKEKALVTLKSDKKALAAQRRGVLGMCEYAFTEEEEKQLMELVYMVVDVERARKYPTDTLKAVALGIPVERLKHWRRTPDYMNLLDRVIQVVAKEGVAAALPGQIEVAVAAHLEGSGKAFESLAKLSGNLKPENVSAPPKEGEGSKPSTVINVENLLINHAKERLGIGEPKIVYVEEDK